MDADMFRVHFSCTRWFSVDIFHLTWQNKYSVLTKNCYTIHVCFRGEKKTLKAGREM